MKKGFTLVELLVVVAILGVLAAVGIVAYSGYMNKSKINVFKSNEKTIVDFIKLMFLRCEIEGGKIQIPEMENHAIQSGKLDCDYPNEYGAIFEMNNLFMHYFEKKIGSNLFDNDKPGVHAPNKFDHRGSKYNWEGTISLYWGYGTDGECNSNIQDETTISKMCLKIISRLSEYPNGRKDIDLFMSHW